MIDYRHDAVIYSISIMHENKKYVWIANSMNYPLTKEINIKRLKEGTHISKELQEIYNLSKLENNEDELVKFEELHYELKAFWGDPMSLAAQLAGMEYLIKKDMSKYNKKFNKNVIILN